MEKEKDERIIIDDEKENIERNLVESEVYDNSIKVIILGDSYVGKSSLINRLINNKFVELASTLSIEYHTYIISINEYKIRMQLWDTAGQEKYNSIISNYYKGTDVAIFVYSIDKQETFENIQMWFKHLKENNDNSLNILIGNKLDTEKEGGRVVSYENAENFARDNNFFLFREVSCKSKETYEIEDIFEIFDEIGKYFYEKSKEKNNNADSISYKVSDSMRTLGEKHKIKKANEKNKKKVGCC
jgi:small GTP-binding protein